MQVFVPDLNLIYLHIPNLFFFMPFAQIQNLMNKVNKLSNVNSNSTSLKPNRISAPFNRSSCWFKSSARWHAPTKTLLSAPLQTKVSRIGFDQMSKLSGVTVTQKLKVHSRTCSFAQGRIQTRVFCVTSQEHKPSPNLAAPAEICHPSKEIDRSPLEKKTDLPVIERTARELYELINKEVTDLKVRTEFLQKANLLEISSSKLFHLKDEYKQKLILADAHLKIIYDQYPEFQPKINLHPISELSDEDLEKTIVLKDYAYKRYSGHNVTLGILTFLNLLVFLAWIVTAAHHETLKEQKEKDKEEFSSVDFWDASFVQKYFAHKRS